MSDIENEKAIINESPDFETQRQILTEEKLAQKKLRKFYTHIGCIFFLMFLIIIIAYVTIDIYIEYNFFSNNACLNVNVDVNDEDFKLINIAREGSCIPEYNIDYYNNRRAMFNLDLFGDKTKIYNAVNQKDENGYCKLNCDANNDGWPDYNIDLNGDGIADINIVKDYVNSNTCDLNCDLNFDTIPDTNIDINNDGIPDINITGEDRAKPLYNIDYKGNRKPEFNIKNADGSVTNPVNTVSSGSICTSNCDIDGDGWPDYNITLNGSKTILNELITSGTTTTKYDYAKTIDWKCYISSNLTGCLTGNITTNNKYINIDVNGDGTPDVNISSDKGENITNPLNKKGNYNSKEYILNEDYDKDGFPDYNIDINNDGIPDLNITDGTNHICIKNCDTNFDGTADYLIDYDSTNRNSISIKNINLDIEYDAKCDVNCDTNYDLYPDLNIDLNGDNIPDLNIDTDGDGKADLNIDTNSDGKADKNLSARLDGVCNFNCEDKPETNIDYSANCTVNCDTDGDGWPDKNVDLNHDGECDINCNNNQTKVDKNHDYFIDEEDKTKEIIIDKSDKKTFYILNPIDIMGKDIEPGWNDTYILNVVNNTQQVMVYQIHWNEVTNNFTAENNLHYYINRNGALYLKDLRAPYGNDVLKDEIYIRPNTTVRYVMNMSWVETDENQNIDSGKEFKGKLIVTTKK